MKKGKPPKKLFVGSPQWFESAKRNLEKHELFYLILDLPFRCNFDCPKCYRKGSECIEFDSNFMEARKKIIKEAAELGVKTIVIAGEGEPFFFWDQVKELIEFNNSLDLITNVYTNGSLLNGERINFLHNHNVSLIISLDSINPKTYEYLTGGGNLDKVFSNLEEAKTVYSDSVSKLRANGAYIDTRLAFITIVSEQNCDEIKQIHEWVGNEAYHIVNFMVDKSCPTHNYTQISVGSNTKRS